MDQEKLSPEQIKSLWQETLKDIETQVSPATYNTWILANPLSSIEFIPPNKANAICTSPSAFHAMNLQKNFYSFVKNALESQLNKVIDLKFIVGNITANSIQQTNNSKKQTGFQPIKSITTPDVQPVTSPKTQNMSPTVNELFSSHTIKSSLVDRAKAKAKGIGLRLDYTFKTFAVSTTNEMAHAAASAVSNSPGTAYNPLFLYGGVGVGKTHLMHAIANNILQKNPETSIIYCTGEEFTNEIIRAIQTKKAFNFKNKYRKTQVLLIDDVQFIAGKNAVQEEFFHTFNALTKQSSQIVLTSDRPPHEINFIEDRLRSRFEAGLMIDIQQPSFELRTAILLIKSQSANIQIPMDLAQHIASKVDSARKIEGIITYIRSEMELKGRKISSEMIDEVLKNESSKNKKILRVKPQDIIKTVANHFRVKQSAIKGKRRTKDLVLARHVSMFLLRNELKLSLEEIGKWFSGRDHTSVLHATQKIEKLLQIDEAIKRDISALKMSLLAISN